MNSIHFSTAYYIKLGRGGCWAADSIATGKLRLGWPICHVDDINLGNWDLIEKQIQAEMSGKHAGAATNDLNALKRIVMSEPSDVWITFHENKLWWTRLADTEVKVESDEMSKFRRTSEPWHDHDVGGRLLFINELPGKLTQLQGFRATTCRVNYVDLLERTINGTRSELATTIEEQRSLLNNSLSDAIKELHWKDFETLVDLVFRAAGWIRISVLGQQAKGYDIELREPITNERYVVQVKSEANLNDLKKTCEVFSPNDYKKVFFVVHSPSASLEVAENIPEHVELILSGQLAILSLDAGLVSWIADKVS